MSPVRHAAAAFGAAETQDVRPHAAWGLRVMSLAVAENWERDRVRLEHSLYVFLAVWIGGAAIATVGGFTETKVLLWGGVALFLLSIIPYVITLVHAYRLQDKLSRVQGRGSGAWVVLGGVFLNPYILGAIIPALVLRSERNARAQLHALGGQSG